MLLREVPARSQTAHLNPAPGVFDQVVLVGHPVAVAAVDVGGTGVPNRRGRVVPALVVQPVVRDLQVRAVVDDLDVVRMLRRAWVGSHVADLVAVDQHVGPVPQSLDSIPGDVVDAVADVFNRSDEPSELPWTLIPYPVFPELSALVQPISDPSPSHRLNSRGYR
jgi:hypothetical protein